MVVEFSCDCCGKKAYENYDLSNGNTRSSYIRPAEWIYINNGSHEDALVCDECWNIYSKVKNLIK
jgi:hypothetical protein